MAEFDGKLVFTAAADGSGKLVFGVEGDSGGAPGADLWIDGDLPDLDGEITFVIGYEMAVDGDLPDLDGEVGLQYDSGVYRDEWVPLGQSWEVATSLQQVNTDRWQDSQRVKAVLAGRNQEALCTATAVSSTWSATVELRNALLADWQDAAQIYGASSHQWENAIPLRSALDTLWCDARHLRGAFEPFWQNTDNLRSAIDSSWQSSLGITSAHKSSFGPAAPIWLALNQHWQEATRPLSGETKDPGIKPPEPELCYDPATVARLIFSELATGDGKLVFVCVRKDSPEPGETIVIPIRRVYMTVNSALLFRLDNGYPIPTTGMRLALDWGNWTWSFSASVRGYDFNKLRSPDGRPVLVRAFINGSPFDFAIEKLSPSRTFSGSAIEISGRGLSAELDEAESGTRSFSNDIAMSALQLVGQVLTNNDASIGWSVDTWQPTDWIIPAGVFSHSGSYISAVNTIAEAVGAYVQPKNTERKFDVLLKYPKPHWEWDTVTPDIQLPSNVVSFEGIEFATPNQYNRVFVLGQEHGVHGQYTRFGTPGDIVAPTIIDPLVTSLEVVRQRGRSIVSAGGPVVSLKLPVLSETGIIKPGKFIRYVDNGIERIGISRSVSVDVALPTIYQTIGVETHGY